MTIRYNPITMTFTDTSSKVSKTREELLQEAAQITAKLVEFRRPPAYTIYIGKRMYITEDGEIHRSHKFCNRQYTAKSSLPIAVLQRIVDNGKRRLKLTMDKVAQSIESNPTDALKGILAGKGKKGIIDGMVEDKLKELGDILSTIKPARRIVKRFYLEFAVEPIPDLEFRFDYSGGNYKQIYCNGLDRYNRNRDFYKKAMTFLNNFDEIRRQVEEIRKGFTGGEQ